jgi:probable F420-dependent oxidoreductase
VRTTDRLEIMRIDIGTFGIWRRRGDISAEMAAELESLGYGAIWIGGSPPGDLGEIEELIEATERVPVITGIVNMWRTDASTVAQSYHRIEERHPDRFVLGVGVGHPEATAEYQSPLDKINTYLDGLDGAGVPADRIILAALGPKALRISAERTAGAHPYLTTPRHTTMAREVIGDGPLLTPEHKVVLEDDSKEARSLARPTVGRYLRLVNYRNNLLREGWSEKDLEEGGSDALVDELVLHGDAGPVAEKLRVHLEAGADHVCIHSLRDEPLDEYRQLAGELLG